MSPVGALELRRAFDASFASEPVAPGEHIDFLALGVAGRSHAVRVTEVATVVPLAEVVGLPVEMPGLLGVAAVRGQLVTVYHLGSLLGEAAGGPPRWMLLSAGRGSVGLAFDEVEGYLRVALQDVAESWPDGGATGAREIARVGSALRPVVSIPALLRQVGDRLVAHRKES